MDLTRAQAIELFHVAFLQVLPTRLDQARYVLKGGANLRYFFNSVRYSEDIDLDVSGIEQWRVEEKVDAVLHSGALKAVLRTSGLEVGAFTKPKQTETTQRWKVPITAPGQREPVRSKVEFSNRNGDTRYRLEAVPSHIVEPYALRATSVQHYIGQAPREQKVRALEDRNETQARDVFDLDLLLRQEDLERGTLPDAILAGAIERALALPFGAFRDQVLPFLEADVAELYASVERWDQMKLYVADKLEAAR
jgi:predicted nucleotidyltransferase component of viral defense system